MCRQTFIEKAIPVPEMAFRLVIDKKIRLDLPAGQSLTARFLSALGIKENEKLFSEISAYDTENNIPQWKITIILGTPDISRTDKKQMMVFVNGRRIQEYSMLQAIDYGAQGYFPNGTHPVAALFIELNPQLVDFNIHPAKKEVRFKDSAPIHHAVSSTIRSFYHAQTIHSIKKEAIPILQQEMVYEKPHEFSAPKRITNISPSVTYSKSYKTNVTPEKFSTSESFTNYSVSEKFFQTDTSDKTKVDRNWKYIGQVLGVFLVVEKDDSLLLVDQHAGHERIRYNEFMQTAGQKQQLLIPLVINTTEKDEDEYLEKIIPELSAAGFDITNKGSGHWEILSVPIKWEGTQKDLQRDLLEKRLSPKEVIRSIAATTACRGAIKDGNIIDRFTAEKLLEKIFALPEPRCPHGRPIWTTISKEELFKRVLR